MSKKANKEPAATVAPNPKPKGKFKILGGSRSDEWNMRLANLVGAAMPGQSDRDSAIEAKIEREHRKKRLKSTRALRLDKRFRFESLAFLQEQECRGQEHAFVCKTV